MRSPLPPRRSLDLCVLVLLAPLAMSCGGPDDEAPVGLTRAYARAPFEVSQCPAGANVIEGTSGNDVLMGTAGVDCILGYAGDDRIEGLGGDDVLMGGAGADELFGGEGADHLDGELDDDFVSGGDQNDRTYGGEGDDVVHGGAGDDFVYGDEGADTLFGDEGADQQHGGDGCDQIAAAPGADVAFGEAGNDLVVGSAGSAWIGGGEGDDRLAGPGMSEWSFSGEGGVDSCPASDCELAPPTVGCDAGATCAAGETCILPLGICAPADYCSRPTPSCGSPGVVCTVPVIVSPPWSPTVEVGSFAVFGVVAQGGMLRYQWQRDGVDIPGATQSDYHLIQTTLADDGARFRAVVTNDVGTVTSPEGVLSVIVPGPPVFALQPVDVIEHEGRFAHFSAQVIGAGVQYQWERDGVPLAGETEPTLRLGPVTLADDGAVVRVAVQNAHGALTSAPATLHVLENPRIVAPPESLMVEEGASASFHVVATGDDLTYQWQRNGVDVPGATGPSYTLETTVLADDGADFRVVVGNGWGSIQSMSGRLFVVRPAPVLIAGLVDQSVAEHGTAVFEVVASGRGLTYSWTRAGVAITGAVGSRLELPGVVQADDGTSFGVTVSNEGGSVSSSATLHVVAGGPVIASEPADLTVVEGGRAELSVVASGAGLSYQWERDGVAIPGATSPLLVIDPVSIAEDGASLRVVVVNASGSVTSRIATLSVTPRAPVITRSPASSTVAEGDDATFDVEATGSLLQYAWQRDGVVIAGATSPVLVLSSTVAADDGAQIVCIVSNASGSVASAIATLHVTPRAPQITSHPADASVDEGSSVSFGVAAEGAALTYQWRRDGAPVPGATSAVLTLPEVTWSDRGAQLDCIVSNGGGSTTSNSATLDVRQVAPRIIAAPSDTSAREGDPASFTVTGAGSELTYQWHRDGVAIAGATSATLTIDPVRVEDEGAAFTVVVGNAAGAVTSPAAVLHVTLLPPVLSSGPADVTVLEGESFELSIGVVGSQLTYEWQRDGALLASETAPTLRVETATLAHDGAVYRAVARNSAGAVSAEATVTVQARPPVIVSQPASITIAEDALARFEVAADGSELAYQWQRDGVAIAGATGASYELASAPWSAHGASFRVLVSNGGGNVLSDAAILSITQRPPVIVSQPATQTVRTGDPATFSVVAAGSELSYEWRLDGAVVPSATSSTLELASAVFEDDGAQVQARVWNAAGEVFSDVALLHVEDLAPTILVQPLPLSVFEGEPATFQVEASGADEYQWRRDGLAIAGADTPIYTIASTSLADDGAVFDVVVSSSMGNVVSTAVSLTVQVAAPVIVTQPADLEVDEGAAASFVVQASGSALTFQWRRDGVAMSGATASMLALPSVVLGDDGAMFDCVVENAGGAVTTRAATLAVRLAPPSIVASPVDVTVGEAGTATFHVTASGSSLSYQWQRDGLDVVGATTDTMIVDPVVVGDDGARFRVQVSNGAGSVLSGEATLHVVPLAPTIVRSPDPVSVIEGDAATFSVEASGAGLAYEWQRDGATIPGQTSSSLVLSEPTLADDGASFRVVVSNVSGSATSAPATLTVRPAPPRIDGHPSDVSAFEGESVSFMVAAAGAQVMYQWQRDGADVSGATSAMIALPAVELADDGAVFRCVVSNPSGTLVSQPATLRVGALPRIVLAPNDADVLEGALASFTVEATGEAPLAYQWARDGVAIPGAVGASFTVDPTALTDDGALFTVTVSNAGGSVTSAAATLFVRRAPPAILGGLTDVTASEGSSAMFEVVASGTGLSYAWTRNGVPIAGVTGSSYLLATVAGTDDGAIFRVTVSNDAGSVSSQATLHVALDAPEIATQPADAVALEGQPASFHVAALGTGLSYRWERDGVAIPGAISPTYGIANVRIEDDSSTFRCVVSNASGAVTSRAAVLDVTPLAPAITRAPTDTSALEGDDATFDVEASGSLLSYSWRRDGVILAGETGSVLVLHDVSPSDHGAQIVAVVTNESGTIESAAALLTVALRAPTITAQPVDMSVDEGGAASFSVAAQGSSVAYQWRRDGIAISGANTATYGIASVVWADRGAQLDCVVSNTGGSVVSSPATLTVQLLPPRIVVAPADASVAEGDPASFHVEAAGSEVAYQWLRDGVPLAGAIAATYSLPATIDDDGATFEVRVSNAAGVVTSAPAALSVALLPPVIVRSPVDVSVDEGQPIELSAEIHGSRLAIQWEREGLPIEGATSATLHLGAALRADDGARFRIVASNTAGTVSAEATVLVRLAAPTLVASPADNTSDEGSDATFTVVASGSELTYQWHRDGVAISGATGATYTLSPVAWSDLGASFHAVVSNPAGTVSSAPATLTVRQLPPVLTSHPLSQSVMEGELATFSVAAQGSELSYEWHVDGAVVVGAVASAFELGPVALVDDGTTVRARVWNAAGEVLSDLATLSVTRDAPAIVSHPESIAVFEDENATFVVEALRADAYQWRRDGVDIPGATDPVLTLVSVTLADDGAQLDCVVSSPEGEVVSAAATLTVRIAAPRILVQPADLRVLEGAPARFEVDAAGSLLRFQWRRDGVALAGAMSAALELASVSLADDGATFDCVVENDGGQVVTRVATLEIDVAAPEITAHPGALVVDEGGTATFDVTARGSLLSYQWTRDGADVAGATAATLELTAVTLADDGASFAVRVSNDGGTVTSNVATLGVRLVAPRITVEPVDRAADEGASVAFALTATGSQLTYQWRRDGSDIPGATSATYTLHEVAVADDGAVFDCVVTNAAGTATSALAHLSVNQLPPAITEAPSAVSADEGESAVFGVVASGSGLSYRWERDGSPIADATTNTLTLASLAMTDDGAMIRVVVTNDAGEVASAPVRLTVRALPPRIVAQPSSTSVLEGDGASFTVQALGHELSYQWRRGGADIAGAIASTFALSATTVDDDGATFDCVITNASGTVTTSLVTLTVRVAPPSIARAPAPVVVDEGGDASFDVEATGSRLTYQWQRDGVDIATATGTSFALTGVSPDDDGASFRVVVSNEGGSVASAAASLTVRLALPSIITQPLAQTVDEGMPATFHVEAVGSRLEYQWQHDGVDLAGEIGDTLTIAEATPAHRGEYRARVSNSAGEVISDAVELALRLRAPTIAEHPSTQIVRVGESATFAVVAEGAELAYQWFKDGFAIAGAASATHTISAVARTDEGAFHCDVTNSGGIARSTEAVLTVRSAVPRIVTQPDDVTVALGESVALHVVAEGDGLTYQWQRFGVDLTGATGADHTFSAAEADDGVPFHVLVRNDGGEVVSRDAVVRLRDATAPVLVVNGDTSRTTLDPFITLEGTATDDRALVTVEATSDRVGGTFTATPDASGVFTLELPVEIGASVLTLVARDPAGNSSSPQTIHVARNVPAIPRVLIRVPVTATVTEDAETSVEGVVLTSVDPDALRVTLGSQSVFPTGTGGSYSFRFERVPLALGENVLRVVVASPFGTTDDRVTVFRRAAGTDEEPAGAGPRVSMTGVAADTYYRSAEIALAGTVTAARCVASVTANGTPARLTATGTGASFDVALSFGAAASMVVSVTAVDCDGRVATVGFTAHRDDTAPEIVLEGLSDAPDVNPVLENPTRIRGTVRDASLAGVAVAGRTLGLVPTGVPGEWSFHSDLTLARGEVRTVRIAAWDRAGASSERDVRLRLEAQVELAIIAPQPGEQVVVSGELGDVSVEARAIGLAAADVVVAEIDGGGEVVLGRSGSLARGTLPGIASGASHVLRVQARNATGQVLAQASATFELLDDQRIPLEVVRITPANDSAAVEPNAFVELMLNRPVDPARFAVELRESVHGLQYRQADEGADIREISEVALESVDRELEPVPGNLVLLPGNQIALFYPARELAYGAMIRADIRYDDASVSRASFRVRPLPTLVQGFVADNAMGPLSGIVVELPEIGMTATTSEDGLWDLGFGWAADRVLPAGLHRAIVNPNLRNPDYGSIETFVLVREGELSRAGLVRIPRLDPDEPLRIARSGDPTVPVSRGDLVLDLSTAALVFPDGESEGVVHAQVMGGSDLPYGSRWPIDLGFVVQPPGVTVAGGVSIQGNLPRLRGTHDYVAPLGERVLVFGLDPSSLSLRVVGVARLDPLTNRFATERPLALVRLDAIAFGAVPPQAQDFLAAYDRGDVSFADLRAAFDVSE